MEVHFKPDVQAKLEQMARKTGRPSDELVEDAVVGLFDELTYTRGTVDRALRRFGKRQGQGNSWR